MPWRLGPAYAAAGTLPFTWLVGLFFGLSALFHLLNATLLRGYYLRNLADCLSPTRYLEYTFSAAVMFSGSSPTRWACASACCSSRRRCSWG